MQRIYPIIATCLAVSMLASCNQNLKKSKMAALESEVLAVHEQMIKAAEALDTEKMFQYILDSEETVIQNNDRIENRQQAMQSVSKSFELFEVKPDEGEEPPVLLLNKGFMKPFQSVTGIYGLPLPSEMDPTPYLSV